jgi:hypothetical protein
MDKATYRDRNFLAQTCCSMHVQVTENESERSARQPNNWPVSSCI